MERRSFLHFSHFPLVFPSGLDFGPSWAPFWNGFGLLFLTFFASKTDQKINDFSHHFFYEFGSILAPKMALGRGTVAGKSPPRGVQDHLEDVAVIFCLSWLRFGTLLDRFWHDFGRFWHPFSTDFGVDVWFFGPFSLTSGIAPFFFSRFRSSLPSSSHASIWSLHLFIEASLYPCFLLEYACSLSSGMFVAVLFHSALLLYFIFSTICSFIAWRLQSWPGGLREAIK